MEYSTHGFALFPKVRFSIRTLIMNHINSDENHPLPLDENFNFISRTFVCISKICCITSIRFQRNLGNFGKKGDSGSHGKKSFNSNLLIFLTFLVECAFAPGFLPVKDEEPFCPRYVFSLHLVLFVAYQGQRQKH